MYGSCRGGNTFEVFVQFVITQFGYKTPGSSNCSGFNNHLVNRKKKNCLHMNEVKVRSLWNREFLVKGVVTCNSWFFPCDLAFLLTKYNTKGSILLNTLSCMVEDYIILRTTIAELINHHIHQS